MSRTAALVVSILAAAASALAASSDLQEAVAGLFGPSPDGHRTEVEWLDENWKAEAPAFLLDTVRFVRDEPTVRAIFDLLRRRTGHDAGDDWAAWARWFWNQDVRPPPDYADFKSRLYRNLDPKFEAYFSADRPATIRLDEIVWGGVRQDGIPPLRSPKMIPAGQAAYLGDDDVVFGIEIAADARAYPKRILAWHEMFVDTVGGVEVAGVYCTLCGTVVLYETKVGGVSHRLGTSGFLYRSNKLMYDRATQSLWSTLDGQPVVGPLVGRGIDLPVRTVVTTTWAEWRRRHPDTTVLSPETGHERDYREGAAYRSYFATDRLMFPVPKRNPVLANKDEVLVLRFGGDDDPPVAIRSSTLRERPIHHGARGGRAYVVLTDASGAHRVYGLAAGQKIVEWDGDTTSVDADGTRWQVTESALESPGRVALPRLPSHNAFWFGWFAAHPDTELVH